jgi:hypothetical protein
MRFDMWTIQMRKDEGNIQCRVCCKVARRLQTFGNLVLDYNLDGSIGYSDVSCDLPQSLQEYTEEISQLCNDCFKFNSSPFLSYDPIQYNIRERHRILSLLPKRMVSFAQVHGNVKYNRLLLETGNEHTLYLANLFAHHSPFTLGRSSRRQQTCSLPPFHLPANKGRCGSCGETKRSEVTGERTWACRRAITS